MISKLLILLFYFFSIPFFSYAQTTVNNPLTSNTFTELIGKIAKPMTALGMAAATIAVVYGGWLYVSSGGNEQKINTAKQVLIWSVVGIFILLVAPNLPKIICGYFGMSC